MPSVSRKPLYWGIGLILGALLLGGVAMALWPAGADRWDWHGGMMGGYGWGWGGATMMTLGMLSMAAFWIGIILVVIWAIRAIAPAAEKPSEAASPLEIAKARYARGEISKQEFEELKKDLG